MSISISADTTLEQAIADHRAEEDPGGNLTDAMSTTSARAFDMHDAVHLIFNCDTSLKGEIAAHAWMAFATTAPLKEMHEAVANDEHRNTLVGIGHGKLILTWLTMLPRLGGIAWKSRSMKKKIDYQSLKTLMPQTLGEIRAQHGIRM